MTTSAVTTCGLGKRYGRHSALSDCTLSIPADHVVGLAGPNGAGKANIGFWHFFAWTPADPRRRSLYALPVAPRYKCSYPWPVRHMTGVPGSGRRRGRLVLCRDGCPGRR
jgi:hypothetical protein